MRTVIALELWDAPVGGKRLQEWRDDATFPARLAEVTAALCADQPAVTHVHITGGAVTPAIVAAITHLLTAGSRTTPVTSSDDPFAAARAGLVFAAACADVGQTGIKLACGERAWRVERDLELAPMRDGVAEAERPQARDTTIRWLASVLAELSVAKVVVALPCELVDGVPRGCTYCWNDPDVDLVAELARRSGKTLSILNDAELAAHAAAAHVPATATTLVLTIGFGVGGALLLPSPA